jgi:hypothetical protein
MLQFGHRPWPDCLAPTQKTSEACKPGGFCFVLGEAAGVGALVQALALARLPRPYAENLRGMQTWGVFFVPGEAIGAQARAQTAAADQRPRPYVYCVWDLTNGLTFVMIVSCKEVQR